MTEALQELFEDMQDAHEHIAKIKLAIELESGLEYDEWMKRYDMVCENGFCGGDGQHDLDFVEVEALVEKVCRNTRFRDMMVIDLDSINLKYKCECGLEPYFPPCICGGNLETLPNTIISSRQIQEAVFGAFFQVYGR